MKRLWVALFIFPSMALAEIGSLQVDQYCSFNNDPLPKQLITFSSDADARAAISRIMQYTGLPPRFKIMAADVPNAAAIIKGNQRYILYNQFFMSQIKNATQNQWAQISILAHEIGHHLSSHTLEESGSRPHLELEADMFSGHVLQRMGASMEDAVAAMKQVADENGSRTHPPRRSRIAAIANGWKRAEEQAKGKLPESAQTENAPQFKREPSIKQSGEVEHFHNGRSHTHLLPDEGLDHQHGNGKTESDLPATISLTHNLQLMRIPAGSFQMGSQSSKYAKEKPVHTVTVLHPFWMSRTEITFAQYDAYATAVRKPKPHDAGWGRNNRPVINVSWNDAQGYIKWLSNNNEQGLQCRLPSEAEWEYAARAKHNRAYGWGDTAGNKRANCDGCSSQWDNKQTAPTGSFPAVGFGLYDMHGNVLEWTQDRWRANYQGAPVDGSVWNSGADSRRVLRGGSWRDPPVGMRSASRYRFHPNQRSDFIGFRVACSLPSTR